MTIFLCGFMGCGKSTIGEKLAQKLNCNFIDMDKYIEQKAGLHVTDHLKTPVFRRILEIDLGFGPFELKLVNQLLDDGFETFIRHDGYLTRCLCIGAAAPLVTVVAGDEHAAHHHETEDGIDECPFHV